MRKVAIFGGSFSPPHTGHRATAAAVLEGCPDIEAVYWTPCGQHVWGKHMTDSGRRLDMVKHAIRALKDGRHQAFDHEIAYGLTGRTLDLALSLNKHYPETEFQFVIGMDNANSIRKWYEYARLVSEFRFIVLSRAGVPAETDWYKAEPHRFLSVEKPAISSSEVRAMLARGDYPAAAAFLEPEVLDYIIVNDLYSKQAE